VLGLPSLAQAPHGRGRQAGRIGSQQGSERLLELAGRYALEIEPGQQLLEILRPAQVSRQDRGRETDRRIGCGIAIPHARPADLDRPDAGLDLPLRGVPVTHQTPATLTIDKVGVGD
jgi:hypothetical protein